jgi:regulation of enolase protein 1 (concanavalin A-like superfamily)
MVRLDRHHRIKASIKYETSGAGRLGAVTKNGGFSDCSTQDVAQDTRVFALRIERRGNDFVIHAREPRR